MTKTSASRILNSLFAIILSAVIVGAYCIQFLKHETPCPLCMLQRLCMIGVATGCLLNLKFGIKPLHYGLSLFYAFLGGAVAVRQISLHICPGFPKFGEPFWGYSLYTWSFLVFACSTLAIGFLLCIYENKAELERPRLTFLNKLAFWIVGLVIFANMITTYQECGLSTCIG